ncbi:MAG TPA: zinc-ribbon domain-containing protein [Bacteroidales bacterium]|nr:zinc-ribbon domain-containing protein [Bacteroidales bacterium]
MFCKECGKQIDNDSKFCSYCGTKQSLTYMGEETTQVVNEKKNSEKDIQTPIFIEKNTSKETKEKYDSSYEKEAGASFIGILGAIVFLILFVSGALQFRDPAIYSVVVFILFIVRIFIIIGVVNIAGHQNREKFGWGLFTFFLPFLALSIIGFLPKLKKEQSNSMNDSHLLDRQKKEDTIFPEQITFDLAYSKITYTESNNSYHNFFGFLVEKYSITFTDGGYGKIQLDSGSYYFKTEDDQKYYYNTKEAAIKALYYYITTKKCLKEGYRYVW